MAQDGGGGQQFEAKDMIVFAEFDGMNTQSQRWDLDEKKAAWMENLQPIGKNNLLVVPAAAAALALLTGETITKQYYFNYGQSTDYIINFCASGAAYAVTNPGGVITKFANAGTFSPSPDATTWDLQRVLIADPTAGYCSWDPISGLVVSGGVSPNIQVTAGGSGYSATPSFTITTSGAGTGAAMQGTVVGGVLTAVKLINPGTGYGAGDTVTVVVSDSTGTGATVTAHVWPQFTIPFDTLAIFGGRVWLGSANIINYTGTGATYGGVGYDDFLTADAAGSLTIEDADLTHLVTALRNYNNYLFIIGDQSVKQIGNITVSGTSTNFTIVTLSSDQGTTFRDSVISYNRLVLFANTVGVYAIFGNSVEKISDELDGIFRLIDFTQLPVAAINDLNNIHTFMLLVKYNDPAAGARALILAFMNKKWFVMSQGDSLDYILTAYISGSAFTFSASGDSIAEILADPSTAVSIKLQTALTSHEAPYIGKKTIRVAIAQSVSSSNNMTLLVESERSRWSTAYTTTNSLQFVSDSDSNITFLGSGGNPIDFFAQAVFSYFTKNTQGASGIYLGMTLTGMVTGFSLNSMMVEYGSTAAFGNTNVTLGGQ